MTASGVSVATRREGRTVILAVAGRIDHNSAADFRDLIEAPLAACAAEGDALVFDLAGLDYISSAGLRVFMIMSREAKARHGRIVLAALQPLVQEIFDISKFTLLFEIFASTDAACAAVAPPGAEGR